MMVSRRNFLRSTFAVTAGFAGLRALESVGCAKPVAAGYGELLPDPQRVLDLPKGFSYRVISQMGRRMDDGLVVPGQPDGMGSFVGPNGLTLLVRNHELNPNPTRKGAFGWSNELLDRIDKSKLFADGSKDEHGPRLGGTTTIVYDTKKQQVIGEHLSLAGTWRNCAGGVTPWGTWVTCEEPINSYTKNTVPDGHGYCFEVRPTVKPTLSPPTPIKPMGRFNHEAIAVDPNSGAVYLTEDRVDGLFYRYLPSRKDNLHAGGKLQALVVRDKPSLDTSNWESQDVAVGKRLAVTWIDLEEIDAPKEDLRLRGFADGAAMFSRAEGIWYGNDSLYFAATSGGNNQKGQVWRYFPSPSEGTAGEANKPGELELFLEPNDHQLVEYADNLTVAPWGDLVICEDAKTNNELLGVSPRGEVYRIAKNQLSDSELAGCVFSPDGSTLFVNIQAEGITLAITGPWQS